MQLHSPLSATARPFQPGTTSSSTLVDDTHRDYPARDGLMRSSPPRGSTRVCLLERPPPITITPLMRMGCLLIPPSLTGPFAGGVGAEEVKVTRVVVTPMKPTLPATNASRGKVPVLTLVIRELWLRLLAINLTSIKPQPSWHLLKRHQTLLCQSQDLSS